MCGDVLADRIVQKIVDVPSALVHAEIAAEDANAAVEQRLQRRLRRHRPVDDRRRCQRFLAGKATDLISHHVHVGEQLFRQRILIRTIRHVAVGVKGQLQPVGVVSPLAPIAIGELRKSKAAFAWKFEIVGGRVEDVEHELRAVLPMQLADPLQIKAIEERSIAFLGDVPQKEAVVVDGEAVTRLAVSIPHHANSVLAAPARSFRDRDQIGFMVA